MSVLPEEAAATLVRAHRERLLREHARGEAVRARLVSTVTAALREGTIRRAWLIGSLAWGTFGEGSDADVVVEGLETGRHTALWDELTTAGVAVDLLRLEDLTAPFRDRVLHQGVPLGVACTQG